MSLSRRQRTWPTRKTLANLDRCASTSVEAVEHRLKEMHVTPPELAGNVAWGQYLDDPHHSDDQWGRFGTTSAVIALALINDRDVPGTGKPSIFKAHPLDRMAPVLPEQWPVDDGDQAQFERLKADDFATTMKLAYMVDALKPDLSMVGEADQPQLVDLLLGMSPPPSKDGPPDPAIRATLSVTVMYRRPTSSGRFVDFLRHSEKRSFERPSSGSRTRFSPKMPGWESTSSRSPDSR